MQMFAELIEGFALQAQSAEGVPSADKEDLVQTLAKSLLSDRLLWLALQSGERLSAAALKMMTMTAVFPGQEGRIILPLNKPHSSPRTINYGEFISLVSVKLPEF